SSFRGLLRISPDTQEIAAPDLCHLLVREATPLQARRNVARFARVVPADDAAAAVEVRGDADVIDAGYLDGVLNVVQVVLQRRERELLVHALQACLVGERVFVLLAHVVAVAGRHRYCVLELLFGRVPARIELEETGVRNDLDDAALRGDGPHQIVRQVTRVVRQRPRGRMRGDDRGARHTQHIAYARIG